MHISQHPTHTLDLRVRELTQLFNSLDPTPFLNKDLDRACEAFIENWALSLPDESHLHIIVHVENLTDATAAGELVSEAIHNYYGYKIELVQGQLRQLLGLGRTSLAVGLVFVTSCLLLAEAFASVLPVAAGKIARESLTIIGWVALWRPIQIFLYDWWPLKKRIRVFHNLQFARVSVVQARHEVGGHPHCPVKEDLSHH